MTDVRVIQPQEMGTDFVFDQSTNTWKITLPKRDNSPTNAIVETADGLYVDSERFKKYRLIQDTVNRKIKLYEYLENDGFDESYATLIDEVDMVAFDLAIDDVGVDNSVLSFFDEQTQQTLTFDVNSVIYQILTANTATAKLSGDGKSTPLEMDVVVDPSSDNLLKITTSGLSLDKNDLLALLNSTGVAVVFNFEHDVSYEQLTLTIGDVTKTIATSRLVNTSGVVIGHVIT